MSVLSYIYDPANGFTAAEQARTSKWVASHRWCARRD
jgi:hypothetical protein